jgi:hypothetical protein
MDKSRKSQDPRNARHWRAVSEPHIHRCLICDRGFEATYVWEEICPDCAPGEVELIDKPEAADD